MANCSWNIARDASGPESRATVESIAKRLVSPATTRPWSISPASIIVDTTFMPSRNPRQAFPTSKLTASGDSSMRPCTMLAVEGSRWSRLTEVLISAPMSSRATPLRARASSPACAATSLGIVPSSQMRRSTMPASFSSRPLLILRRPNASASRSSRSAEVTTWGASTCASPRMATWVYLLVARISSECVTPGFPVGLRADS